ncbi:hypothetical protein SETIT_3G392300v2 [Setaria italica]|uniref:Origin recognition complex subunit 3 N-terminal domain-containing protein n=1 Tax=Setaria italica TaxID=4555 RepID=A0A368QNQ6_SETIT|nr:hypothetical protein SETIT_3G392300v2 [Setaria italica]
MSVPASNTPLTAASKIQPFLVLHKAAASSVPSSRARHRIQTSQPSSSSPKLADRCHDAAGEEHEDEGDAELYEKLRLEAFHQTWSKILSTIDKVLKGINLKLFDQVLQWVKESFSLDPQAFILTKNAEFVDDITTFWDLARHLESNGCHLAKLSAAELSAKHGVGGCYRSLLRQLLSDVADLSALASWYCEAENYDQPIIVIIDDLEHCSGAVLGEFVMMLSEWPCKLALGSPLDRMNALVEVILVKPCAGFCISHEVAMFLRNYFFRHDGTITSFISALKLACSKHFSLEPLSFLCLGMLEEDCEEFWRDKFEALPQQILKYAFGLPSCASAKNSSNSSNNMVEGPSKLLKLQKDWGSVLLCLYEAGRHDKVQLLDIFCEAVNPNLQTENVLFVSKVTCENLSGVKSRCGEGFIAQVMNMIRRVKRALDFHLTASV